MNARQPERRRIVNGTPEPTALESGLIDQITTLVSALREYVEAGDQCIHPDGDDHAAQLRFENADAVARELISRYPQPVPGRDEHQLQIIAPKVKT